jgi:hypothetical protein
MRYKRPDKKNALSILESAERDMKFTLSLEITEFSGATIIRNMYECFRMVGDAVLVSKGIKSEDHILPIKELLSLDVKTERPISLVDNLRRLRHNINYYGYKPSVFEVEDFKSFSEKIFETLKKEVLRKIKERSI